MAIAILINFAAFISIVRSIMKTEKSIKALKAKAKKDDRYDKYVKPKVINMSALGDVTFYKVYIKIADKF